MKIAVAGGTGHVGHARRRRRHGARGHDVVVLTRGTGVDLVTGAGLAEALEGVDAVIDVASVTTLDAAESDRLLRGDHPHAAGRRGRGGVGHHVALSIVGIDVRRRATTPERSRRSD